MDPDRAAAFAEDLLDEEKLKDMTAADGTLPGGALVDRTHVPSHALLWCWCESFVV